MKLFTKLQPVFKNTSLRIWIVALIGVILILISLNSEDISWLDDKVAAFIESLGRTFFVAAVIALILNVPSLLSGVYNSSINLFKDNSFLQRLDIKELNKIRADATESAYLRSGNGVNDSLKLIDKKIAGLFLHPYYSSYDLIIKCKKLDDKYIEKTYNLNFVLMNPANTMCNAMEHYTSRAAVFVPEGENIQEIRKILSVETIIDDSERWSTKKASIDSESYEEESLSYNNLSHMIIEEDDGKLMFKDKIQVRIKEKRLISLNDKRYVHRVSSPVEKFTINYSFKGCEMDLIGTCFGTFQDTKDGGIDVIKDENSIHISSSKWLLNGNGIIIVHNEA